MPTSVFCYQPGDIIYVQAGDKVPMRSYEVLTNGTLREVGYDSVPASNDYLRTTPIPTSGKASASVSAPPDATRQFRNHGKP